MPDASRPYMPGYGIQPADAGSGLLSWAWAETKLLSSHDYWLGSSSPDGRPHLMPVWGIWMKDGLWFSSAAGSRKARNLLADGRCTAATDDALNPVVIEGVADLRGGADDRACLPDGDECQVFGRLRSRLPRRRRERAAPGAAAQGVRVAAR